LLNNCLGRYQFETVKEGVRYHAVTDKSTVIDVYISKVKKVLERGNIKNLVDDFPGAYFVEVQSITPERDTPSIAAEVAEFCTRLAKYEASPRQNSEDLPSPLANCFSSSGNVVEFAKR